MTLSAKEKKYLKKLFDSDTNLDLDIIIEVLNKKRTDDNQVDIEEISDYIDNFSASSKSIVEENSKNKPSATLNKQKKRVEEIKAGKELENSAANATFIAATVFDELRPHFASLLSPPPPKHYMIVSSKTQAHLQQEVNKFMKQGWQPYGGVGAAAFGISPVAGNQYIQAMVLF
jgi:hypothetical protein|tara:strand:- start:183 stop:704 length:522 start_codon:yes stop_codon:yes gene_type:complete